MSPITPLAAVDLVVRTIALAAVAAAGLVLLTHWAVRRGHLQPFGPWPRLVRRSSDPLLQPLERRLVATGRNPQDAGLWLFGGTLVAGLLLITLSRWLVGLITYVLALRTAGPLAWIRFLIASASTVVMACLVIRVIGKWLGRERWHRLMRPVYLLTDWIVMPLRRRIRLYGGLDLSPLFAYLIILVVRTLLLEALR